MANESKKEKPLLETLSNEDVATVSEIFKSNHKLTFEDGMYINKNELDKAGFKDMNLNLTFNMLRKSDGETAIIDPSQTRMYSQRGKVKVVHTYWGIPDLNQ
jgi:hypothetical protein